jgi:hypothetical protein
MSDWKQTWKGEYIRKFYNGEIGKILKHGFLWRVVLDDRRVDHIFLSAAEAMEYMDIWNDSEMELTFEPIDREWCGDDNWGYSRMSKQGELEVEKAPCKRWTISQLPNLCFEKSTEARRHADENLP